MNPVIAFAIPFFVLTMLIELAMLRHRDEHVGYSPKDSATSITMGVGYLGLAALYN